MMLLLLVLLPVLQSTPQDHKDGRLLTREGSRFRRRLLSGGGGVHLEGGWQPDGGGVHWEDWQHDGGGVHLEDWQHDGGGVHFEGDWQPDDGGVHLEDWQHDGGGVHFEKDWQHDGGDIHLEEAELGEVEDCSVGNDILLEEDCLPDSDGGWLEGS